MGSGKPRTLAEKVWDDHVVDKGATRNRETHPT